MILIEVDVSYPKLAGVSKSSEALEECLILIVGIGNETGVTVKSEAVLLDDVLSDLGEIAVCVNGNTVVLAVVNCCLLDIVVRVCKIDVNTGSCNKAVYRIEVSLKSTLYIKKIIP